MDKIYKFLCLVIFFVSVNSCSKEKTLKFEFTNTTDYVLKDITIRAGCMDSEGIITISLNPQESSEVQKVIYKGCAAEFFSEPLIKGEVNKILTKTNQEVDIKGRWLYGRYELEQNTINRVEIILDSTGSELTFVLKKL